MRTRRNPDDPCVCGHPYDEHLERGGECKVLTCVCPHFEPMREDDDEALKFIPPIERAYAATREGA